MNNGIKILGIAVLSFGLGVALAFFLPESLMIVIEAAIIAAAGIIFLKR